MQLQYETFTFHFVDNLIYFLQNNFPNNKTLPNV